MAEPPCPSKEQLSAFVLGTLSEADLERIAQHLEVCPACDLVVRDLDQLTDPLLAGLARLRASQAGAAAAAPLGDLPLSGQIGDYQVLREIGRGGMGIVYEAVQLSLSRRVALKVLPRHALLDAAAVERFRREARAAGRLHHTNIVPVYGTGEEGGLHFFAMQFIPGASLDAVIRRLRDQGGREAGRQADPETRSLEQPPGREQPAPPGPDHSIRPNPISLFPKEKRAYWRSIARVGLQCAEALAYAHAQGVLHRDIKPSNLLVDPEGTVWVTDFGLAKGTTDADALTHTGDILGTLRYAPPERFQGRHDARGDVYGLGLTLYELLTLRPAFAEVDRNKLLQQVMHTEPPRPRTLAPALPRDLETIVLKSIARDPAHRYQTAGDLADDLRRFLDDRPVQARRASRAELFGRWCRREPITAGLLAALLLVFLAGFAGVASQWRRALGLVKQEADARDDARKAEANALDSLYFSQIAQARLEWRLNNVPEAQKILTRCEPAQRGWEWQYLDGLTHSDLLTLERPDLSMVTGLCFSPDGHLLAVCRHDPYAGQQGQADLLIEVWNLPSQERVCELPAPAQAARLCFSPDGRFLLASALGEEARLWETAGWRVLRTWDAGGEAAFSPDSKQLAAWDKKDLTVWDVASGAVVRQSPSPEGRVAFSPDGKLLALSGKGTVELQDSLTGRVLRRLTFPGTGAFPGEERFWTDSLAELCFSPDSKTLVTGNNPPTLWDVGTGLILHRLVGHTGSIVGVDFSPDGRTVATAGLDGTVRLWNPGTGLEQVLLRGHPGRVGRVCFHPDGWRLASGGRVRGEVKLWDLTRPQEQRKFSEGGPQALSFTEDGSRLRVLQPLGRLLERDVETTRVFAAAELALSRQWLTPARQGVFSGDGRVLAIAGEKPDRVLIHDAARGREQAVLRGMAGPVIQVALDREGRRAAAATVPTRAEQREVLVWDVGTGRLLAHYRPQTGSHSVALSPDGSRVAFVEYRLGEKNQVVEAWVKVCAAGREEELLRLSAEPAPIIALCFSADGGLLAAGDWAGRVLLWDQAGQRLHENPVLGPCFQLCFSPDGRRLAGVDREQVKVWDVARGQEVLLLRGAGPRPSDGGFNPTLTWSPDGQRLAAGNWDGTISIWDAGERSSDPARAELAAAQARAPGFHLRWVQDQQDLDGIARRRRARLLLLAGLWDRAATDFTAAFQDEQAGPRYARWAVDPWLNHARLLLLQGNGAGHQRLCAGLLTRFGPDQHPAALRAAVRACVLGRAAADPAQALLQAQQALDLPNDAEALLTLGLAHSRAAEGNRAVEQLMKAALASPETAWSKWPALALAHLQRGDRQEAARWLAKAEQWLQQAPGRADGTTGFILGEAWLDFQILLREAQALLEEKQP